MLLETPDVKLVDDTVEVARLVSLMPSGPTLLVLVSTVIRPVLFEAVKVVEIVSSAPASVGRYSMTVTAEPEDGSTVENEGVEPE